MSLVLISTWHRLPQRIASTCIKKATATGCHRAHYSRVLVVAAAASGAGFTCVRALRATASGLSVVAGFVCMYGGVRGEATSGCDRGSGQRPAR